MKHYLCFNCIVAQGLTGKKKRTTRRGFKTAFEADMELKRLELDLSNEIPLRRKKA
ncbi:Arm DNA-binding domain-containing protein [Enterococcus avium]